MTPMIDVTFLLLIFFMLTIQFRTLEGLLAAHLPRGVGGAPTEAEPRDEVRIRIDVLQEGTPVDAITSTSWDGARPFRYGPDRRVRWSVGPWSTTDARELALHLREAHRSLAEHEVVVDARARTIYSEVVTAVDAARAAGWERIGFAAMR
jgi:biopolymer transport protein ExbD